MNAEYSSEQSHVSTMVDLVEWRAAVQGEKEAFVFLNEGEEATETLTFEGLAKHARALAAELRQKHAAGTRALLLYPPGLSFLVAFFGCMYAGLVPVPAYPPRPNRHQGRLAALVRDCGATVALSTPEVLQSMRTWGLLDQELGALDWVCWDSQREVGWSPFVAPAIDSNSIAFLQYTSGSTGSPKGVVVTHGNLLHNEAAIQAGFRHSPQTRFVGWLPLFHDMGLIGNVLQPLYLGIISVLMPPMAFLQHPVRWLQAISRYKATTSGAPNFAYSLCAEKVSDADCVGLDLSSWEVAYNGSEPVRADTLERFARRFAPCGFRAESFYPCYGMAETTLFVTGGEVQSPLSVLELDAQELTQNRVRPSRGAASVRLVGCGRPWNGMQLRVVEPDSGRELTNREVGEIWIAGGSVAAGYWGNPGQTERTFNARLAGRDEVYLRTGDLGFVDDQHLYITGRLKDLIIIRGKNHYPQDIELGAESAHPALASGGGAAFSVDMDGEERLVVVHEIDLAHRKVAVPHEIVAAIRTAVAAGHDLRVHQVVLLRPRSLPRTSSGKVRRNECRRLYLSNELPEFTTRVPVGDDSSAQV